MAEAARQEIVERQDAPARAIAPQERALGDNVLSMIERASKDPAVNVDKMLQLMAMRKEVLAEAAESEFDDAMAAAQSEMAPIRADSNNPQTKSRYASYAALDRAIRPIYTKHGFAITFDTKASEIEGCVCIVARVSRGSSRRFPQIDMPADGKGAKGGDVMTRTHAVGSAVSYGMRYLLKMIFNLAVGDAADDDDGNSASVGAARITSDQYIELSALIDRVEADEEKFARHMGVKDLDQLPAAKFEKAKKSLLDFEAEEKRRKAGSPK